MVAEGELAAMEDVKAEMRADLVHVTGVMVAEGELAPLKDVTVEMRADLVHVTGVMLDIAAARW